MKIGVISDTHGHDLDDIAATVLASLHGVDLIVHAGDFTHASVYRGLTDIAEVKAVHGNMDSLELKEMLPSVITFEAGGRKIGVTHGSGAPWGIVGRVRRLFRDEDIIIFGHSHQAHNASLEDSLMFNPGTASRSFGIIDIGDKIDARIIEF